MTSAPPCMASPPDPLLSFWPSFGYSLIAFYLFVLRHPKLLPALEVRLPQLRAEQDNPLPCPVAMLCLMSPRTGLALLAARALLAHVQFAINQEPQVPFLVLLSSLSFPRLILHPGLPIPGAECSTCLIELHMAGETSRCATKEIPLFPVVMLNEVFIFYLCYQIWTKMLILILIVNICMFYESMED